MLDCKEVRPRLSEYLAGSLEADVARQMQDHLLTCPVCAAELERLQTEGYKQEHRVSVPVTKDPLEGKRPATPAPAPQAPQPEPELVTVQAEAPKQKPPRRKAGKKKPWRIVAAALLVVALVAAVVLGTGVLKEDPGLCSPNGAYVAVMQPGVGQEKDGFSVQLRDAASEKPLGSAAMHNCTWRNMIWSDSSKYLAVEYTDAQDVSSVFVMLADDPANWKTGNLEMMLVQHLNATEGRFGNTFISRITEISLLTWMPGTDVLVLYMEGMVDTDIDPDFGLSPAGNSQVQPRDDTASRTGGCVAINMSCSAIQVLNGFGIMADDDSETVSKREDLETWMYGLIQNQEGEEIFLNHKMQMIYGLDALLELPNVVQQEVAVHLVACEWGVRAGTGDVIVTTGYHLGTDLQLLTNVTSVQDVALFLLHHGTEDGPLTHAYLVVPYEGWVLPRMQTGSSPRTELG